MGMQGVASCDCAIATRAAPARGELLLMLVPLQSYK